MLLRSFRLAFGSSAIIALGALTLVPATVAGCKDQAKVSAQQADAHVTSTAALVDKDVAEIERGLPEGSKKVATLWDGGADPTKDLTTVRAKLRRLRADVPDLLVAKSTFFALTDDKGVAIRNDLETDMMAGQNLTQMFPGLAKANAGYTTTFGSFPGATGPADKDWLAAVPVKDKDGAFRGMLVTGWSLRVFANHLQESLKHDLTEQLIKTNETGKLPIFYVGVFDKEGVYTPKMTPPVTEQALKDLALVDKTAAGKASGVLNITGRDYGWGAVRTPKLGADVGVVVIRSEI
jgi:hypothetical protein